MIISERHLFKGLVDETPLSGEDQLFHRGHAFAVTIVVGLFALLLIGLFVAAQ